MAMKVLVETHNVKKYFPVKTRMLSIRKSVVHAVDDVSIQVIEGETFGLVGESGCGKSTLGRLIGGLFPPTSGSVCFEDQDIWHIKKDDFKAWRKQIQFVFQNPFASLNPRKTIYQILALPLVTHESLDRRELSSKVLSLLETVGLRPAEQFIDRHPHELSGGQRQRVGIARAVSLRPRFIIADEPVSSLDMSVRGQILNLFRDLQEKFKLTYLMITHDLAVVRSMCDRAAAMYLGEIVELASAEDLCTKPLHPYTQALVSAVPVPNPEIARATKRIILKGDVPSPISPPSGCRFRTRCPYAFDRCTKEKPLLREVEDNHLVACHLFAD